MVFLIGIEPTANQGSQPCALPTELQEQNINIYFKILLFDYNKNIKI